MAEKKTNYKLVCQQEINKRKISIYPNEYYFKLVIAHSHSNLTGRSATGIKAIKHFFDSMSDKEKKNLISLFQEMTPEQIERPGRF